MKIIRISLGLFLCFQFVCCATSIAPDGTKTTSLDIPGLQAGAGVAATLGSIFMGKRVPVAPMNLEVTATK